MLQVSLFLFLLQLVTQQHHRPPILQCMQAFTRVDVQTGKTQTWFPGIRCFCEELVFVPGPKAATDETDGFLLGMVYDAARHKSFLAVSSSVTCEHIGGP